MQDQTAAKSPNDETTSFGGFFRKDNSFVDVNCSVAMPQHWTEAEMFQSPRGCELQQEGMNYVFSIFSSHK